MPELAVDLVEEGGCLQAIIDKAAASGVVSLEELVKCLASRGVTDSDQVEDIAAMLKDMGFEISC